MKKIYVFDSIPFQVISKTSFIQYLLDSTESRKRIKIFYLNVHNCIYAFRYPDYLSVLKRSNFIYADGWGPLIYARLLFGVKGERVNAADFINDVLFALNRMSARVYLLGSDEFTLRHAIKTIRNNYKNISVTGKNGFFSHSSNKKVLTDICKESPNLVLVGMGTPRQEKWIDSNIRELPAGVYWAVGGLFDYIAGTKSRAPRFMRDYGLEWLYRFMQEPGRLFVRSTFENVYFGYLFFKSLLSNHKRF